MKKISLFLVVVMAALFLNTTAKAQAFEQGAKVMDAGFEILDGDLDEVVVPIYVSGEYGVTDDIGVGAKLRFWSKDQVNNFTIQATGSYHFGNLLNLSIDNLDPFGGIGLGITRGWYKDFGVEFSNTAFIVSPHVGARYYFTDKVGATARIGLDTYSFEGYRFTNVSVGFGVSLKF